MWAIRIEQAIHNLYNRFDNLDAQMNIITNDLAIVANGSKRYAAHRLRAVRNEVGQFPEWFSETENDLIRITPQHALYLAEFYNVQDIAQVGDGSIHLRRLKAIADHIGVRDLMI